MIAFRPAPDIFAAITHTEKKYVAQHEAGLKLLIGLLYDRFGITADRADIKLSPSGKPYLASCPEIHFNITHTGNFVAAAVSRRELGIDLERVHACKPELALRWLKPFGGETVSDDIGFTRAWTRFESYIKLTGRGLAEDDFSRPHEFIECDAPDGFVLTICAALC